MERFVQIRTRNYTARPLRRSILFNRWAVVRLGSRTPLEDCSRKPRNFIEVNTVEAVENSRSKLRMKNCFKELKVPQAEWWSSMDSLGHIEDGIPFPLVVKRVFGFQGRGMTLINDQKELDSWLKDHHNWSSNGWYFEKFYNYAREYRLHVSSASGVFLSWRKLRTKKATDRWYFTSHNSNWIGEDNELFDRPKSWKAMEKAAIDALKATKLDLGAVDIRVQSNNKHDNPKFIVCEINSAPALGELGVQKYKEEIIKILKQKSNE